MRIKRICIYCGSSTTASKTYLDAAANFARLCVERGYEIVYGAGALGLMGATANAALAAGGKVIGVVPKQFVKEVVHQGLTEKIFVDSMRERKRKMIELADAFVALPGGYGTLDEVIEVLTLSQLGALKTPCGFLNVKNFYDKFFDFLEHSVKENLLIKEHKDLALISEDANELLNLIENYTAPKQNIWWDENLKK